MLCDHYERDLRDAEHLAQQRPGSVLVVKYEELVTQPRAVIPIILKVAAIFFRASSLENISRISKIFVCQSFKTEGTRIPYIYITTDS